MKDTALMLCLSLSYNFLVKLAQLVEPKALICGSGVSFLYSCKPLISVCTLLVILNFASIYCHCIIDIGASGQENMWSERVMQHAKDLWRESNRLYCMCIEYLLIPRSSGCNSFVFLPPGFIWAPCVFFLSHWTKNPMISPAAISCDGHMRPGGHIYICHSICPIQALLVYCSVGRAVEGETDVKDTTNSNHRTLSPQTWDTSKQKQTSHWQLDFSRYTVYIHFLKLIFIDLPFCDVVSFLLFNFQVLSFNWSFIYFSLILSSQCLLHFN